MQVTSQAFNQRHEVIARFPILQGVQWDAAGPARDVIDLNRDGQEGENQGFSFGDHITGHQSWTTTEPALSVPYKTIKTFAKTNGTEMVTAADIGQVGAHESKLTLNGWGDFGRTAKVKPVNERSLQDVATENNPFPDKPVKWAIDTAHNQFVIYSADASGTGKGPLAMLQE